MKQVYKGLSLLALSALCLGSCSKHEVEIVDQNNAYSIDPKGVAVTQPDKVTFDPSNLVRVTSEKVLTLEGLVDINQRDRGLQVDENKITLKLQLKKPLKVATKVELRENRELLKEFVGDKTGRLPFPTEVFASREFTIPADVTEYTAELPLANLSTLTNTAGYLSAYSLNVLPGGEEVVFSTSSQAIYLYVDVDEHNHPNMPKIRVKFSGRTSGSTTLYQSYGGRYFPGTLYIEVELDKVSPEPIKLRLRQEPSMPLSYVGADKSNYLLPDFVLPLTQEFTIPAGALKQSITLQYNSNPLPEKKDKGYIAALRVEPISHPGKVKADKSESNYFVVTVNVR